jgi:hypothetical protein
MCKTSFHPISSISPPILGGACCSVCAVVWCLMHALSCWCRLFLF